MKPHIQLKISPSGEWIAIAVDGLANSRRGLSLTAGVSWSDRPAAALNDLASRWSDVVRRAEFLHKYNRHPEWVA